MNDSTETTATPDHTVVLEHRYDAPPERVFAAWTNPDSLAAWSWGRVSRPTHASMDFRVGGGVRLELEREDGATWAFHGTYTAIEPGVRIEHTLAWDAPMGYGPVPEVLEATFAGDGSGTTVTLTHHGLPSERSAAEHHEGWAHVLETLARHLGEEPATEA